MSVRSRKAASPKLSAVPARARDRRGDASRGAAPVQRTDARELAKLMSHLPGMVYRFRTDRDGTMEFVSDGCLDLTGYRAADFLEHGVSYRQQVVHPDDRESAWRNIRTALREKRAFQVVYRVRTADASEKWVSEQGRGIFAPDGTLTVVEGFVSDVSDCKRAELSLAEQAVRDALTGLYNRRYFDDQIAFELARARRTNQFVAFLLCDLDRFKSINDTKGHLAGDEILRSVARTIQSCTRGTDLIVRWGGDEIVVVLTETGQAGGLIVGQRIRRELRRMSEARGLGLDMSIGIAMYPEHGETADALIRLADRALYIAKKSGDKIHIGEEHYRLDEQAIKVVFQPVVDVWSDQVLGHEALSRDPQGRLSILELFKKYHAVGQLDELKRICFVEQLRVAAELKLSRVFLNVDLTSLEHLDSVVKPPGMDVILEISEVEALHDVENHLAIATKWRAKGFKFAIDDFGAGFVSLPFIARLMPEYIKIDRSLVIQSASSDTFKGFSRHLLLALRMYATEGIIAEGIETEKELQAMKGIGIFLVQGFLLGKPKEMT